MPRQADPKSRPGILRSMEVGDSHTDTKDLDDPRETTKARSALTNLWAAAISRVTDATFSTETAQVVTNCGVVRLFITIKRIS